MRVEEIKQSYLNVSGKIYNSEFINLANIKDNRIALDKRTLFLTEKEKDYLNSNSIEGFEDVIYIFKYKESYGIVCDVPISEYKEDKIKCHELVIPETIQGMLSNLHGYNCEAAPTLLAHRKKVDYEKYINNNKYSNKYIFPDLEIFVLDGENAKEIIEEFKEIDTFYVADGHHRLYTTSLSNFKNSVLSCVISFEYLDILPIHRILNNIDAQVFERGKEFIYSRFEVESADVPLSKGKIRITYNEESFVVNLIELNSDAFWNNDIYRLNTQIVSQAFRIFDTSKIKYVSHLEVSDGEFRLDHKDMLIETYPVGKDEFVECANNKCIMPPKSTWFSPKFPSFLIFKQYQ